jgi:hypothetical protein
MWKYRNSSNFVARITCTSGNKCERAPISSPVEQVLGSLQPVRVGSLHESSFTFGIQISLEQHGIIIHKFTHADLL